MRPRFHLIYFALAAFDLVAVSLGLFLIDRISVVHRQSIAVSQEWGQRLEGHADLMQLAAAANAPGNDVFSSRDVEAESRRLREAHQAFHLRSAELRHEVASNVASADATALLARFDGLDAAIERMVKEAELILDHFRRDDLAAAGQQMAAMDRQFVQLIAELSDYGVLVGQLQRDHFQRQMATADNWRKLEYLVAALIVLMVAGVTIYGQTLARRVKEAARELDEHRVHLEEMVEARTAELRASHEQLRLTDRLASIGTLAAGLGHDMNNVLLPVRARLDALEAAALPASANEQVSAVRRSVAYLQQLSDGLHLLALDPEDAEASGGSTRIAEWWKQVGPLLTKAVPKRIQVDVNFATDLPEIALAPHRLTQAMLNLVVNAGEAIVGEGHVRVWARPASQAGWVEVGVTDTGEGMTEEVQRRALDPFFTTKKRGLGTGLGLSLVRGVAQSAGGTVEIESAPGKGTIVTLRLPASARRGDRTGAPNAQAEPVALTISDRRAATFVSAMLKTSGVQTVPVVNGEDPGLSRVWILEPSEVNLEKAKRYLHADRRRRIVLFGSANGAWESLGVVAVGDTSNVEALRRAIAEALAEPPHLG